MATILLEFLHQLFHALMQPLAGIIDKAHFRVFTHETVEKPITTDIQLDANRRECRQAVNHSVELVIILPITIRFVTSHILQDHLTAIKDRVAQHFIHLINPHD